MSVKVSVVVPTYRRDDLLAACLERLLDQSLPPSQYEIIVCDDGPAEATRRLVEAQRRRDRPAVQYIPVTATQGPAAARNRGWQAAAGSIIAFTDDDCLPERDWLSAGLAAIEEMDAATGRTIVPLPDAPTDYERDTAGLADAEFITANCFVRRSALQVVGGFDERFTSAWREDSDLHFSLLKGGFRIAKAHAAVVVHPVRPAPWGVSVKLQRKGLYDPLLWQKHPQLYRQRIPPLPRLYYGILGGLVLAFAGVLTGMASLAVAGLAVWLAGTAFFTWQRLRRTRRDVRHILEMAVTSALIPPLSVYWRLAGLLRFSPRPWSSFLQMEMLWA